MTRVIYNGVELGLVRTMKVEQKAKYDPSNTDMLYIENRVTVHSILSYVASPTGPLTPMRAQDVRPADAMVNIRMALLRPRQRFQYLAVDANGTTALLDVDGTGDSNNGPKPVECTITQVTESTWQIDYVIDVAIPGCGTAQDFASNRYETTHDIDFKGYSTITTLGRVIVRSDMQKSPDALREVVTPPMPAGFRRSSMYQITEDGLAMNYKFVDKEMFLAPPSNAVDAQGRFSVTAIPPGGLMVAQCDITLEGRKDQSKRQLMEMAVLMAVRRLEKAGVIRDKANQRPFISGGSMVEELFENRVEVSLKAQLNMGRKMRVPNDQFQAAKGFWKGLLEGGLGLSGGIVGSALTAGDSTSLSWGAIKGFLFGGIAGTSSATAAVLGRLSADQAKANTNANAQANQPDPSKAPEVLGGTLASSLIDRFGTDVVGTSQRGFVDPGLKGNIKFMAFLAAAFRDPCVVESVSSALGTAGGGTTSTLKGDAVGPHQKGRTPKPGERMGRALDTNATIQMMADWTADDQNWSLSEGREMIAASSANVTGITDLTFNPANPALDWLRGRLVGLPQNPPDESQPVDSQPRPAGRLVAIVTQLDEIDQPVPPDDDYPGVYESWYCEVVHDLDGNQDALPATVPGVPAKRVAWSNPVREVTVRWACSKTGFPPEAPVVAGDTNVIVTRSIMELPTIEILPDGHTPRFTASGETTYKVLDESYTAAHFPTPPWLRLPMTRLPGPIPDPSIFLADGGGTNALQVAAVDLINNQNKAAN